VTTLRAGRVVPVAGARVYLAGVRATTDARGRAVLRKRRGFERVRAYRLRAAHPDYRAATMTLRSLPRR
jgi:hypothetical protein